jgi:hypothetical protein
MEGLARFAFTVLKLTLVFELAGAAVCWRCRWAGEMDAGRARCILAVPRRVGVQQRRVRALLRQPDAHRGDWVVNLVVTTLVVAAASGSSC